MAESYPKTGSWEAGINSAFRFTVHTSSIGLATGLVVALGGFSPAHNRGVANSKRPASQTGK
jgi:hypothetical protein